MTSPEQPPAPIDAAPMARTGRPPTLTPDLAKKIVDVVRVGNYLKTAAAYCGVGYSTLLSWQKRGRDAQERVLLGQPVPPEERIYLEFLESVEQGKARAQVTAVTALRSSFKDNPRMALEFLARTAPEQWASHSTVQVQDADSAARVAAAVDAATASLLHVGDAGASYDPDEAGAEL